MNQNFLLILDMKSRSGNFYVRPNYICIKLQSEQAHRSGQGIISINDRKAKEKNT